MTKHHQTALFDDAPENAVSIVNALGRHKPADKQQAAFQRLLRQVDEQRSLLSDWNAYGTRYHQRVASELLPVFAEFRQARRNIALLLDRHWEQGVLRGKVQREKLKNLLLDMLDALLEEGPDSELDALYAKHGNTSFADEKAAEMARAREIVASVFGVPMDDFEGTDDLEEMFVHAQKKISGKIPDNSGDAPQQAKRKTARQAAAELKKDEAAKKISQTVREVYRKLASALHPDRETDAAARASKTEQMQRVNQAYQAGDLLALLNLQFEIEQIDTEHLASLSGERLTHYNQVLREQLAELKTEVEAVTAPFKHLCQWQRKFTPEDVDRKLSAEIVGAQQDLRQITADLERLQDPAELKRFISEVPSDEEILDEQMLDEIFLSAIASPPTPRKRSKKKAAGRR